MWIIFHVHSKSSVRLHCRGTFSHVTFTLTDSQKHCQKLTDLIVSIISITYPSDIEHLVNVVIRALNTSILRELTEHRKDTQLG